VSPKTKVQVELQRQTAQKRILSTALRLFAENGYEKTSIRTIAREVGMALGLLYNYFSGKEELLQAIFQQSVQDIEQSLNPISAANNPLQELELLIKNIFQIIQNHITFWQLFYSLRAQASVRKQLQLEIEHLTGLMFEKLHRIFGQIKPDDTEAEIRMFIATVDGVGNHYAMDPAHYPLKKVTDAIIERYCR
jgi:AcrR family transcriptional regulator